MNKTNLSLGRLVPNHSSISAGWPAEKSLTPQQYSELHLWAGITFIIVYGAAFGNLLTILAIIRARWFKTGMQILIASLTTCDLLISFFVYPGYIVNMLVGNNYPYNNRTFCRITGYIVLVTSYVTPIHCCMIAINRLFAIVLPRYAERFTNRAAGYVMAAAGWIIPAIVYVIPLAEVDGFYGNSRPFGQCAWAGYASSAAYATLSAVITLYGPSLILAVCYITIYIRLRYLDSLLHRTGKPSVGLIEEIATEGRRMADGWREKKSRDARKLVRRWQVAKMMGVTFLVFVVCYIPMTTFFYVAGTDFYRAPLPTVLAWLFTVSYLGPFCNPIIYAIMNKDFNNAYIAILQYLCGRQEHTGHREVENRVGAMVSGSVGTGTRISGGHNDSTRLDHRSSHLPLPSPILIPNT